MRIAKILYAGLLAAGVFTWVGCGPPNATTPTTNPQTSTTPNSGTMPNNGTATNPTTGTEMNPPGERMSSEKTNTAINERDRVKTAKTPLDQDENQADINVTAEIRQRIIGTADLSTNARNVKIITSQGKTTLRGPVDKEAERELIDKIAKDIAGADNVDNQLEVAK